MQWTVLPRSCSGYHPGEAWLFSDAEHDAQWDQFICGGLRRRRQSARASAPQSGLQPDLGDLAALLRKTVFLHETNKRHVPFSAHRFVRLRGLELLAIATTFCCPLAIRI